ncbi:MAG: dockerin type I domain-containing protein, partial [Rubripirellula sp.]|nr:dockerin type I domain-containing protein [Rubripirellula sp.]
VVIFAYSDPANPLIIEISNAIIDGNRVVIDAIRIERLDDAASIPVFSSPGDATMILNHNDAVAEDTNLDDAVITLDALLVINDIQSGSAEGESQGLALADLVLLDVNADGSISARDALLILNQLSNIESWEGEASQVQDLHTDTDLPGRAWTQHFEQISM